MLTLPAELTATALTTIALSTVLGTWYLLSGAILVFLARTKPVFEHSVTEILLPAFNLVPLVAEGVLPSVV